MKTHILLPVAIAVCMLLTMSSSEPQGYAIGEVAQDFSLKNVKHFLKNDTDLKRLF